MKVLLIAANTEQIDMATIPLGLASVAAVLLAVEKGARIVRVHDVAATRQALAVWHAMQALHVGAA